MSRSDFHRNTRAWWIQGIDQLSARSTSATWIGTSDIVYALAPIMGSNRNHAHLPGGGGLDFEAVSISSEPGCLDFQVGRMTMYRAKPQRLLLERINTNPAESFFLLELDELTATGVYPDIEASEGLAASQEECVELGDGTFLPRSVWDDDCLPNGESLPSNARLVVRLLRGKVMFVTKGSIWNGAPQTYDGRHSSMNAAQIRSVIERSIQS